MRALSPGSKVVVVGAGLAGSAVARALVELGYEVRLVERASTGASGPSGNPAGIFKPILSTSVTLQSRLSFRAQATLVEEIHELTAAGSGVPNSTSGIFQLAKSAEEEKRFHEGLKKRALPPEDTLWLDAEEASRRIGFAVPFGAVFWPRGGWVSPRALVEARLNALQGNSRFLAEFSAPLRPILESAGADAIVVCAGAASRELPEFAKISHHLIRGQLSEIQLGPDALPHDPLAFHEYVIPLGDGRFAIGATHDRGDESTDVRAADHERLLERFGEMLPGPWRNRTEIHHPVALRAGLRFSTQSRLPIVGFMPESSARAGIPVYALTALGSRGILWSKFLADALAEQIRAGAIGDADLGELLRV